MICQECFEEIKNDYADSPFPEKLFVLKPLNEINVKRVEELGQLIVRNSKWLYEETSRDHSNDELQMLNSCHVKEMFELLGIEHNISTTELNPIDPKRKRKNISYKKIYVNSDPVRVTPTIWKRKIKEIYKSDFTLFVKEHKKDIEDLKHPDRFGNYSNFLSKTNMVLGGTEYLLDKIKVLKKGLKRKREEIEHLVKENSILKQQLETSQNRNNTTPYKPKRNPISKSIRHEVFVKDDFKCVECGATNQQTTLHVDHIIPVSQGGSDELRNLQTLCEQCNIAKNNRAWVGGTGEPAQQPEPVRESFMKKQFEKARADRLKYEKYWRDCGV